MTEPNVFNAEPLKGLPNNPYIVCHQSMGDGLLDSSCFQEKIKLKVNLFMIVFNTKHKFCFFHILRKNAEYRISQRIRLKMAKAFSQTHIMCVIRLDKQHLHVIKATNPYLYQL